MRPRILLVGPEIINDTSLIDLLRKIGDISLLTNKDQLETVVQRLNINLVVMELSSCWRVDLHAAYCLNADYPLVPIVVINDGESVDIVIQSFHSGARDFFKKPYDPALLAERIEALTRDTSDFQDGMVYTSERL